MSVAWRDLQSLGFAFSASGIASRVSRSPTVGVRVKGYGSLAVRPRDSDFETLRQVFRDRSYGELPDFVLKRALARYEALVASGSVPVIVDAGANIGAASLWFTKLYPRARIIAVEPEPANAQLARHNVQDCPQVEIIEAAIGGEAGYAKVVGAGESYAFQTQRTDSGCPIVTIDECVARVPDGALFIAKIDIEGFERDLFAANTQWLDEVFLVYVEPHEWMLAGQRSSAAFQREFGQRDFAIFLSGENLVYLRNEDPAR